MIGKQEIQMFKLIPATVSELADKMNIYPGSATKITQKLLKNGLIKKHRQGKKVFINKEQTIHAQKLEEIIKTFPRLPIEQILSYSNLRIISLLNYELKTTELQILTNLSRQWITKTINQLSKHGIILKKEKGFTINPIHHSIYDFARYYIQYRNHQKLKTISEDAQMIWQHGSEFLFKTKKTLSKHQVTAVTAFSKYNLSLLGDTKYYYNTKRKLQTADIILHTILINPQSKTYNAYACLLYEKTKPENILKKARIYDLTDHIQNIISFIKKQKSEKKFLPSGEEYESLAKQYGLR